MVLGGIGTALSLGHVLLLGLVSHYSACCSHSKASACSASLVALACLGRNDVRRRDGQ